MGFFECVPDICDQHDELRDVAGFDLSNLFENSEAEEREILNSLNYRVIFMTKVVVSVHSLPRDEVLKEAVGKASFFLLRASEEKLLVEHSILLIEKLKEPFSC